MLLWSFVASAIPIEPDAPIAGVLQGQSDTYTLTVGKGRFLNGVVDQVSVDVVVTITDPDGVSVSFDGPGRGPEYFELLTTKRGHYTLVVEPFEGESGEYAIHLAHPPIARTPQGRIEQRLSRFASVDTPGGVVAVMSGSDVTWSYSFGAADLTQNQPFTEQTPTNIGSTSKHFTAFAILLLEEQGELDLDDDIRAHFPDLPDLGHVVTIRHLLTHTSGLREVFTTASLFGGVVLDGDADPLMEQLRRQEALQNEPGKAFNYNNSGYMLAARLVAKVGGRPFPEWMHLNVFEPLGMHDTVVRGGPHRVVPRAARGYRSGTLGYEEVSDLSHSQGAGGIYTTVADLALWVGNLHSGVFGPPEFFARMTAPGPSAGYGFGLFLDDKAGERRVHHGGADRAHRSMLAVYPDLDKAVYVASNNAAFDSVVADTIAEAFFLPTVAQRPPVEPVSGAVPFDFDPERFTGYVGFYELKPGFVLTVRRNGEGYEVQATGQPAVALTPLSNTDFRLVGVEAALTFHPDDSGRATAVTLDQKGRHRAARVEHEVWAPSPQVLSDVVGGYVCPELGVRFTVAEEDGSLTLDHPGLGTRPMTVKGERVFEVRDGFSVRLGDDGGLVLDAGRTDGIRCPAER